MADTTNASDVQGAPIQDVVYSTPYTSSTDVLSSPGATYLGGTTYLDYKVEPGQIDGNNVIWWGDLQGQSNAPAGPPNTAFIHSFDTVNKIYLPTVNGCAFLGTGTYSITAWSITSGTSTTFTTSAAPLLSVNGTRHALCVWHLHLLQWSGRYCNCQQRHYLPILLHGRQHLQPGNQCRYGNRYRHRCRQHQVRQQLRRLQLSPPTSIPSTARAGVAVDSAGDVWTANGTQGKVTEVIGIAAPTWPLFIHNGTL